MIVVKIMGGPGNQFFQYAFSKAIAKRLNVTLYLDLDYDKSINDSFYGVSYVLDKYKINAYLSDSHLVYSIKKARAESAFIKFIKENKTEIGRGLRYLFRNVFPVFFYLNSSYLKDENTISDSILKSIKDNTYLDGYWARRLVFEPIIDEIRTELTLKKEFLTETYFKYLSLIENANQSVSLHIRRGPYESVPEFKKIFGLMPLSYYKKAIKFIENNIGGEFTIFIFSNDLNWARKNLQFKQKLIFIDAGKDYLENQLMSKCSHNIIANSTFSWWAAYLNNNPNKIVIAPQKWYVNEWLQSKYEKGDMIPNNWIKL